MLYFLLIVAALFGGFSLYASKYKNPYKLVFIFGKKGSGKTCLMIRRMIKDIKQGWNVYTDIKDLNINGVRVIDSADLSSFIPPEHSSLYLDEAGLSFNNRDFKNFTKGLTEVFKLQRHYKIKITMNSQSFDVDKKIRDCADSLILMNNIANVIAVARPIKRSIVLTEPTGDSESRIADRLSFAHFWDWQLFWLPSYFKFFNSFSTEGTEREEINFSTVISDLDITKKSKPSDILKQTNYDDLFNEE